MTAKEYLIQSLAIEKLLESKKRLLKKLRAKCESLSSQKFGDKVKSSAVDSMKTIDRIVDLENEIMSQENSLVMKQKEILEKIQLVCNPTLIAVLTDKYIIGMSIEQMAEAMNISRRTACVWHGQALQVFRKETGMK